jgi:hypothetical protein
MAEQYSFITRWQIKAPLTIVWDAIYNSQYWPDWWDGVAAVKIIKPGDMNGIGGVSEYTWKRVLPYSLSFTMRLTEIEKYKRIKGIVSGEVEGIGEWFFEEKDGITYIQYNWDIKTTLAWMNKVAFIMKPLFKFCHNLVMRWGAKGLAKKLNARLLSY